MGTCLREHKNTFAEDSSGPKQGWKEKREQTEIIIFKQSSRDLVTHRMWRVSRGKWGRRWTPGPCQSHSRDATGKISRSSSRFGVGDK